MYTLVIVDDEETILKGLTQGFPWEKLGFNVIGSFTSAKETLSFFQTNLVDVLLTDIRLPFLSGLELIEKISHLPKNKTIFCVMSAYADFTYAQEAIRQGVKYYLLKPASFSEIEKAFLLIKNTLDKFSASAFSTTELLSTNNPLVDETIMLMSKHMTNCSLQSIADSLGINAAYLSRLFKEKTGLNFQDYFFSLKMKKAAELLQNATNLNNKEIAHLVGYTDVPNFCRSFKKKFHTTPGEFRKQGTKH